MKNLVLMIIAALGVPFGVSALFLTYDGYSQGMSYKRRVCNGHLDMEDAKKYIEMRSGLRYGGVVLGIAAGRCGTDESVEVFDD